MDFNWLRNKNLFTDPDVEDITARPKQGLDITQMIPQSNSQDNTTPGPDDSPLMKAYRQYAGMEPGPAQKSYKDFLSTQPDRENPDYKPGKLDRLAAMLGGASMGVSHGAAAGIATARNVLDSKFNDASADFKTRGDRLGKAADLEEKDKLNNVKFVRDFLEDDAKKRENERKGILDQSNIKVNDARVSHLNAQADALKNGGWKKIDNKGTGEEMYSRINPTSGEVEMKPLGKIGLSAEDRVSEAGKTAGAKANAALPANLAVARVKGDEARKTMNVKFEGIMGIKKYQTEHPEFKQMISEDGNIFLYNPKDPSAAPIDTGVKHMSKQEEIDAKNKAAKDLKAAPGAPKQSTQTTTEVTGGGLLGGPKKKTVTTTPVNNGNNNNHLEKPVPGRDDLIGISEDGGKTWVAKKKGS